MRMLTSLALYSMTCFFLIAHTPAHAYKKITTFAADIYYQSEVEFSDVSFATSIKAADLERRVKEHFLEKNWSLNASTFFPNKRLKVSEESFALSADIIEARRPAIDIADFNKDKKILKKWKRSQRWQKFARPARAGFERFWKKSWGP